MSTKQKLENFILVHMKRRWWDFHHHLCTAIKMSRKYKTQFYLRWGFISPSVGWFSNQFKLTGIEFTYYDYEAIVQAFDIYLYLTRYDTNWLAVHFQKKEKELHMRHRTWVEPSSTLNLRNWCLVVLVSPRVQEISGTDQNSFPEVVCVNEFHFALHETEMVGF
jgi:hypothetical protein